MGMAHLHSSTEENPKSLKVLNVLKWNLVVISDSPRDKDFRDFPYEYNIDGLNLKKHFWIFSYSPRNNTFMGFPYK